VGFSRIGIAALAFAVFSLWYACGTPSGPTVEQVQTAEYFRAMGKANNYYLETVPGLTVGKDDVGTGATSDTAHDLEDKFLYKHSGHPSVGHLI